MTMQNSVDRKIEAIGFRDVSGDSFRGGGSDFVKKMSSIYAEDIFFGIENSKYTEDFVAFARRVVYFGDNVSNSSI